MGSRTGLLAAVGFTIGGALLLAGCGDGPSDDSSTPSGTDVRRLASQLLLAGTEGEEAWVKVKDKLAGDEFRREVTGSASKPWANLTPAERDDALKMCFNQLLTVPRETTLDNAPAIDAALAAGTIDVQPRIRSASVAFSGPPRTGRGKDVPFKMRFVLYGDKTWRMLTCENQYR